MNHAHKLGKAAEDFVAAHLEAEGYEILARNARVGRLELDIVARKASLLVFCEVRARSTLSFMDPAESITEKKIANLRQAASLWLQRQKPPFRSIRFDVAAVSMEGQQYKLCYYDSAF
ncbi:MAG: YraN family protein [Myxococcales bacterium]|nr:MAG: YraN family protein [Myxococcales bacterium]